MWLFLSSKSISTHNSKYVLLVVRSMGLSVLNCFYNDKSCLIHRLVELLLHRLKKPKPNKTTQQQQQTPTKVLNFTLPFSLSSSKTRDFVSSDRAVTGTEWGTACNILHCSNVVIGLALCFLSLPSHKY